MYKKGEFIYGYEIIELLGSGGLSQNYKARGSDCALVTLKFPSPALVGNPVTYERFLRELKIGQQVIHPSIQHALSIIDNREGPCMVLEYIEGKTLRSLLEERAPLTLEKSLDITGQLAVALIYLHKHGFYHRDLKPENVLIDPFGRIHIIDFGLALLQGARRVTWQNFSDVLGTPCYMSPEQIQGKRGSAQTDLYALGIMFYEMLTGTVPFHGDDTMFVMDQQLTAAPPLIRKTKPSIPVNIEAIIMKCLRKNPKERYESVEQFQADLEKYENLNISQFPHGRESVKGLITNRQLWMVGGFIAFGLIIVTGLIVIIALFLHK